jgi:hypothetical protein
MPNADEEIALAKLQNDYQLACMGLRGTLVGALAAFVAIVAIASIEAATCRQIIGDWAFAAMVGMLIIPFTFFGAFIFNRALNVTAKIEGRRGTITAATADGAPKAD